MTNEVLYLYYIKRLLLGYDFNCQVKDCSATRIPFLSFNGKQVTSLGLEVGP